MILLLSAAAVIGGAMYYRSSLNDYFSNSSPVCRVPDIDSGFIPQGLAYDPSSDCLFISGYMDSFGQSPIYMVNRKNITESSKINMLTETGETFKGHAGGISVYEGQLFVAGSTKACTYSLTVSDVLSAADGDDLSGLTRMWRYPCPPLWFSQLHGQVSWLSVTRVISLGKR